MPVSITKPKQKQKPAPRRIAHWLASTLVAAIALSAPSALAQPWQGAGPPISCRTFSAVDGDTIDCDGENLRDMGDGAPFVSGYDTPEIFGNAPDCDAERELGLIAKHRMEELLATPGVQIFDSGERDTTRSRRRLVWAVLPDGRSIGSVLLAEGLARVWTPEYRADWC